jgi:hypothetical protein
LSPWWLGCGKSSLCLELLSFIWSILSRHLNSADQERIFVFVYCCYKYSPKLDLISSYKASYPCFQRVPPDRNGILITFPREISIHFVQLPYILPTTKVV